MSQAIQLATDRIRTLSADFARCVTAFEQARPFTGPSIYFYSRAVRIATSRPVHDLANCEDFLRTAYAALTAWGMHRMGPGNTKLPDYDRFRKVVREILANIPPDLPKTIRCVPESQLAHVTASLGRLMDIPGLTLGQLPLVANSKLLHFSLPHLTPPIDRTYTLKFFLGTTAPTLKASEIFALIYPHCAQIARANDVFIARAVSRSGYMCDGDAKLIDNGIVGFQKLLRSGRRFVEAPRQEGDSGGVPWPVDEASMGPVVSEDEAPEEDAVEWADDIGDDDEFNGPSEFAYYDENRDEWVEPGDEEEDDLSSGPAGDTDDEELEPSEEDEQGDWPGDPDDESGGD